ncbi:hypothetical protein KC19_4G046700 [Ceratodon purpureus]|uniref:Uncharacterized protein n=1 Tax=Ceratodon purpureus TaxID=3225 RepID=A0A8T0I552_CERPU|nr:hypothetical protein KC19_4G046700 [Ceratodon purpureus]
MLALHVKRIANPAKEKKGRAYIFTFPRINSTKAPARPLMTREVTGNSQRKCLHCQKGQEPGAYARNFVRSSVSTLSACFRSSTSQAPQLQVVYQPSPPRTGKFFHLLKPKCDDTIANKSEMAS